MRYGFAPPLRFPSLAAALLILATALGGCGSDDELRPLPWASPGAPQGGEDLAVCGGNGFIRYIGVPLLRQGDLIPRTGPYLHPKKLPPNARMVDPDTMVTMEHLPGRLNIMVDEVGNVARLYCG